jgi:hypothetical protein
MAHGPTLPPEFLDWWFAPWEYAAAAEPDEAIETDRVGRRDAYPAWCARAGVPPQLPAALDPGWEVALAASGAELIAAARLFAGLIAARGQDRSLLKELQRDDARWCMSVAATQPLHGAADGEARAGGMIDAVGLMELARRLEQGFPGLWPRLRLMLDDAVATHVDRLLEAAAPAAAEPARRAQRCWSLCRQRAAAAG